MVENIFAEEFIDINPSLDDEHGRPVEFNHSIVKILAMDTDEVLEKHIIKNGEGIKMMLDVGTYRLRISFHDVVGKTIISQVIALNAVNKS